MKIKRKNIGFSVVADTGFEYFEVKEKTYKTYKKAKKLQKNYKARLKKMGDSETSVRIDLVCNDEGYVRVIREDV